MKREIYLRVMSVLEFSVPVIVLIYLILLAAVASGSGPRSQNFYIETSIDQQVAVAILQQAEASRRDLAIAWHGKELPPWPKPCPIRIQGLTSSGGGATSIWFDGTGPAGMTLDGRPDKLIADVVPHEVFHAVNADFFRKPLPRWLDEGLATCAESEDAQNRWRTSLVNEVLKGGRGIPFARMFTQGQGDPNPTAYGPDVLALYWQGFSAVDFLLQIGGKEMMVEYTHERDQIQALSLYGFSGLGDFQVKWLEWVKAGSPRTEHLVAYQGCYTLPNGYRICPVPQRRQPPLVPIRPTVKPVAPQPPTSPPTGNLTPPATNPPAAGGCRCDGSGKCGCDLGSLKTEITGIQSRLDMLTIEIKQRPSTSTAGPPGPQGLQGPAGPPGSIDYEKLAAEVVKRLPPSPAYFDIKRREPKR